MGRAPAGVEAEEEDPEAKGKGDHHAYFHAAFTGFLSQRANAQCGTQAQNGGPQNWSDSEQGRSRCPGKGHVQEGLRREGLGAENDEVPHKGGHHGCDGSSDHCISKDV